MKKLLISTLSIVLGCVVASCDKQPEGVTGEILENVTINAKGSPLNALWENIPGVLAYCSAVDFREPGKIIQYAYCWTEENSPTQYFYNLETDEEYINHIPPKCNIVGYQCEGNPNYGAFYMDYEEDENFGYFYMIDGDKLYLYEWDRVGLPLEKAKEVLKDWINGNMDGYKFIDGDSEEEYGEGDNVNVFYKFTFQKVDKLGVKDLTRNRVTGWQEHSEIYGFENVYGGDCWPFYEGYLYSDNSITVWFGDLLHNNMSLTLKMADNLFGKDMVFTLDDYMSQFGGSDFYMKFRTLGRTESYDEWEVSSEGINTLNLQHDRQYEFFFRADFDKATRHLKLSLDDGFHEEFYIDVDTTLKEEH